MPHPSSSIIAVAATGLGHVARGIEAWAGDLAAALDARGVAVRLFKGSGNAVLPYERVVACCPREGAVARRLRKLLPARVGWRIGLGNGYQIEQVTFALSLLRRLRRERIGLLHVQDPLLARLVQCAHRLGLVPTRVILGHGTEESLAFLQSITYLQHLAPWHLDQARGAGTWRPTWTAIPNFIDTERFAPDAAKAVGGDAGSGIGLRAELGLPPNAVVVLTAAAIKRDHKRIDHLLSGFAALRDARPDLPAWLVIAGGRETQTDELVAWGRALLGDRVRFLVQFPRERMPDLYRAADVFVLASLKEMMPIAVLEAGASGLPCVVHDHPVLQWMTGPAGRTIDMAADGDLKAELIRLIGDRAARDVAGAATRAHVVNTFGRDRVVDQILAYYQTVCPQKWGGEQTRVGRSSSPRCETAACRPGVTSLKAVP